MPVDGLASATFLGFLMLALGLCGTLCAALRIPARWRLWHRQFKPVKVNRKERRWK